MELFSSHIECCGTRRMHIVSIRTVGKVRSSVEPVSHWKD